jgi:SRSO17 transposase
VEGQFGGRHGCPRRPCSNTPRARPCSPTPRFPPRLSAAATTAFLRRYLPRFYRKEQRELADVVVRGRLSKLKRKTSEPIAYLADRERKRVQYFVGAGGWYDEAVMRELRGHVAEGLSDPDAVLVLDPSGFPKKGDDSCGVARQWCGRLGKVENCQVGVFLAYVTARG